MKTIKQILSKTLLLAMSAIIILPVHAQQNSEEEEPLREDAINIFIDGQGLDMNYVREQIPYGNFVRDTRDADVYVKETRQTTGSGGSTYTYVFEGQGEFVNMNDTITYSSNPDETFDVIRESRTNMLKLGLIRYVARTPLYNEVMITAVRGSQRPAVEVVDKWNNWVFEMRTRPQYSSEDRRKSFSMNNSFEAIKVTPDIKIESRINQSLSNQKNITGRGDTITSSRKSLSFNNLVVFSLGDHFSAGGRFGYSRSTYSNYDARYEISPTIEYNFYPYFESTHRQLRADLGVEFSYSNYTDTTVFLKTEEMLAELSLDIAYRVQEKWGYANFSVESSTYLHDFSKNRFEVSGSINYRITRGLSVNFSASYAWIKNQLSLPKGDASVEEILLGIVQLPTTNRLSYGASLSYTFGSIYNNVVNPRFGSGGSGFNGGGGRSFF